MRNELLTVIIEKFSDISHNYKLLICDLWGCLHNGQFSFMEALKTLNRFRKEGGRVVLVTNAPRPKYLVEKQILKLGINKTHYDALLTSGELTSEFIASKYINKIRVFHIGNSGYHSVFENTKNYNPSIKIELVTLEEADLIVCTEPFNPKEDTIGNYKDILSYGIKKSLPFICSNPDLVVDVGEARELCAGSIASFYEELGGKATYLGKPYKEIYQKVYHFFNKSIKVKKSQTLCIGDGINTDIKGAELEKLDSLLVIGGLLKSKFLISKNNKPCIDIKTFNESILMNEIIEPTYAIKFFE